MSDKLFAHMYVETANKILLEQYGCNEVMDVFNDPDIEPEDRERELYEREQARVPAFCDDCYPDDFCDCNDCDDRSVNE